MYSCLIYSIGYLTDFVYYVLLAVVGITPTLHISLEQKIVKIMPLGDRSNGVANDEGTYGSSFPTVMQSL
jgi:hypothetical protein